MSRQIKETHKPAERKEVSKEPTTQKETYATIAAKTPIINMDMDGNIDEREERNDDTQPMDWVKVKIPNTKWKPRPNLTDSVNEKVQEKLNKYVEDTMKQPNSHKTKNQKQMNTEEREERIKKMFQRSSKIVGIGPISSQHISKVEINLIKTGVLKSKENPQTRRLRTIKSLVRSWIMKNLQMTNEEWSAIQVEELQIAENSDIIFVRCKTYQDAAKITANARNLPNESGENSPRIVMHVDVRAMKRHKAILNIAKSVREISGNTVQTSVRAGRKDFLLRKRGKRIQYSLDTNTPYPNNTNNTRNRNR